MDKTEDLTKPAGADSALTGALEDKRLRYCSFCGGSEEEREFLVVADGDVFICERCVEICRDVIGHGREMKRLIALED